MIYITGDCHGGFDRFENDKFSNLTKNDYVIICGDFGGIWDQNKRARYERKRIKQLSKMKFTTLFVDAIFIISFFCYSTSGIVCVLCFKGLYLYRF